MGQGVNQDFAKAQRLIKSGQLKPASQLLHKIIKRYPDHQPSQLLLGRLAYRSGKVQTAAKYFARVSLDFVTPDIAYEFGVTLFTAKSYRKAAAALSRVPVNSKAINLAYFYRGLCYLQGGQSERAGFMLRRAKNLPPNLEELRREGLRQARRQSEASQRGAPNVSSAPLWAPPPPPMQDPSFGALPPPVAPPGKAKAPAKTPPPPPPPSGAEVSITPGLTLTRFAANSDNFGYKRANAEYMQTEVTLGLKPLYNFPPFATGKQAKIQLPLNVAESIKETSGSSTTFIAYSNDPGTVIEKQESTPETSARLARWDASPELSLPVATPLTLAAGFKYEESYPDLQPTKMTSAQTPYGSVTLSIEVLTLTATGNQKTSLDSKSATTRVDDSFGGSLAVDGEAVDLSLKYQVVQSKAGAAASPGLVKSAQTDQADGTLTRSWDGFSANLNGSYWTQTLAPGLKENPERPEMESLTIGIGASKTFEFGGSLNVNLAQTTMSQMRMSFDQLPGDTTGAATLQDPAPPAPPPKRLIEATNTQQSALGSFKLAPIDWAYAQVSLKYMFNTYQANDARYLPEVQKVRPETVTEFTFVIGLSKTF